MADLNVKFNVEQIAREEKQNLDKFSGKIDESLRAIASQFGIVSGAPDNSSRTEIRSLADNLRYAFDALQKNTSYSENNVSNFKRFKNYIESFEDEQRYNSMGERLDLRERNLRNVSQIQGQDPFSASLKAAIGALGAFAQTLGSVGQRVTRVFSGLGDTARHAFDRVARSIGLDEKNGPRSFGGWLSLEFKNKLDERLGKVYGDLNDIRQKKQKQFQEASDEERESLDSIRSAFKGATKDLKNEDVIKFLREIVGGKRRDIEGVSIGGDEARSLLKDYDEKAARAQTAAKNLDTITPEERDALEKVEKEKRAQNVSKSLYAGIGAAISALGSFLKKAFSEVIQYMASVFKNVIQELQDMAGYDTTNNPYKFNARAVSQQLQTGLGSAENYGLSFALQQMGFSSWSDYLANVGYMTNEQRKRMAEMMERGTERYQSMEDSGFLKAVQEMQVEMQEFKLDFEESIMKFLVENKDAIQSLMQKLIDMLPSLLNFFDFVMNVLGVIMNAVSWLVGGSASSSSSLQVNPTQKLEVVVRSDGVSGSTLRQVGEQLVSQSAYGG